MMGILNPARAKGRLLGALTALALGLVTAGSASALSEDARFTSSLWGFDPSTIGSLPTGVMDADDPLLAAGDPVVSPGPGEPALDIGLIGSTNLCILFESSVCLPDIGGVDGPYSVLASVTVSVLNPSAVDGPFVVMLTGMTDTYDASEVTIALNPTAPGDLDTSKVDFDFVGFNPLIAMRDDTFAASGSEFIYYYVGWDVSDGDTITFRYDVSAPPAGRAPPQLKANAVDLTVVPEPGTALLMALGLAGLALSGSRAGSARG